MSDETATDRVRAALAEHRPASLKDWSHALRECFHLSKRQAEKVAPALVSAALAIDEPAEGLADRLARVEHALRIGGGPSDT